MEQDTINIPDNNSVTVDGSQFQSVLLELKRLDITQLNLFLKKVLEIISFTFSINRVSIWFFDQDRISISCYYLYSLEKQNFINEAPIHVNDFPAYFNAISNGDIVKADDAVNCSFTSELALKYLIPKNIKSMMDFPLYYRENIIGILCCEITGERRNWQENEKKFISAIGSIISNAIELDLKQKYNKELLESQRFLSTLISNLPGYVYRVRREDNNWIIQYLSEGIYELTGYRPTELIESDHLYYGLMVEDDKQIARITVTEALKLKKPYEITYKIHTKKGKIKWVWERGRGVYDRKNHLIATEGFITDITKRKLAEEQIIKRNKELSIINTIGQSLSKLSESEKLITDICNMLAKLFDIDNLYIALYDKEKNLISFPYYSVEGQIIISPSRNFGKGLTEFIIKSKKTLLINSAGNEALISLGILPHGKEALSILAAPMIAGEKVLGVITLQDYKRENVFNHSQIEILTTIASQAAIAIENSELYSSQKKSLLEKEILLKEVHHRVKNNLQVMSSLIKLQSHYIKDKAFLDILREAESRIQSMAIVHRKLYSSDEYENINFKEYVKNLTENFWNSYGIKLKNLDFKLNIDNISLSIDTAIPCGLIINELVSNSIKYAFPDKKKGTITITLKPENKERYYSLSVKDDGVGIKEEINFDKADTLGLQLVNLLSKQMNGRMDLITNPDKGCEFIISFEESEYKSRD